MDRLLEAYADLALTCGRQAELLKRIRDLLQSATGLVLAIDDELQGDFCACGHPRLDHWDGDGTCADCGCEHYLEKQSRTKSSTQPNPTVCAEKDLAMAREALGWLRTKTQAYDVGDRPSSPPAALLWLEMFLDRYVVNAGKQL